MASKKPKKVVEPVRTPVSMLNDIMIDLETLDTAVTGVILSIGACRFNEDTLDNDGFYRAITIESNLVEGRTISASTLRWWIEQTDKAKKVFNDPDAIPLSQALDELREWIGPNWANVRPYGNGADFDIGMLNHAYGNQQPPWMFWNIRCFRTIKNEPMARKVAKPINAGAHNALFDAVAQTEHLQAIWKEMRK